MRASRCIYACIYICKLCNSLISKESESESLGVPHPYLLITVTMTVMLSTNTPTGSDGAVNVSVVLGLVTFIVVPL